MLIVPTLNNTCFVLRTKIKFCCINYGLYHHVSKCTCKAVTMAKIQFLTILLAVNCFLGGVVSVTDNDLEVCTAHEYNIMSMLN